MRNLVNLFVKSKFAIKKRTLTNIKIKHARKKYGVIWQRSSV
jgi:hypothetical protein